MASPSRGGWRTTHQHRRRAGNRRVRRVRFVGVLTLLGVVTVGAGENTVNSSAPAIPKTLHFAWFGKPMPMPFQEYMEGWRQLHPEWHWLLWTEANVPPLTNQDLWDEADSIAGKAVWQFRSDLLRYELLLKH